MRTALLLILLSAASLLATAVRPSVQRSAAVFTGRVLSAERVRVIGKDDSSRWELWKAEVKVQTVVTQDIGLPTRLFVYYEQDWGTNYVTESGGWAYWRVTQACPPRPRIETNNVYEFFCTRRDIEDEKHLLFVPQAGWAIRQ